MKVEDLPIVCISLDRRPDRWELMQTQMEACGITHMQRLPAVDAKSFVAHKHPQISLLTAHNILFKTRRSHYEIDADGAVGASLSHIEAWKKLRASSAAAMIVFEDDVKFPPDFKERLEKVLASAPADWDMIQLQKTDYGNGLTGCKPISGEAPWELCTSLMGAFAYIISQRGAERMLAKAFPIEMHIDAYMAYMCRMGHIKMIWNPLIDLWPADKGSDIGHGDCEICNVPTKMTENGVVALETKSVIGLMAMAAVVGGMMALVATKRK
jgi:GR25 family glycosyltransferase involved in LPS biosynthesis